MYSEKYDIDFVVEPTWTVWAVILLRMFLTQIYDYESWQKHSIWSLLRKPGWKQIDVVKQ